MHVKRDNKERVNLIGKIKQLLCSHKRTMRVKGYGGQLDYAYCRKCYKIIQENK